MDVMTKQKLAYNCIWEWIHSGKLLPGQRIVVSAVAEEIGTSGIPVREALLQLQSDGLVAITPHVGATVAQVSTQEIFHTLQTGAVLEGFATSLAHPRAGEIIDRIRAINERMDAARQARDWNAFANHNREFHKTIYSVCENPVLLESIRSSWEKYDSLRSRTLFFQIPDRGNASVKEHQQIVDLLADPSTDPLEIELVAREHKLTTVRTLMEHFPGNDGGASAAAQGAHGSNR